MTKRCHGSSCGTPTMNVHISPIHLGSHICMEHVNNRKNVKWNLSKDSTWTTNDYIVMWPIRRCNICWHYTKHITYTLTTRYKNLWLIVITTHNTQRIGTYIWEICLLLFYCYMENLWIIKNKFPIYSISTTCHKSMDQYNLHKMTIAINI
jgi:hypothetical protein